MKILFVVPRMGGGGAERVLSILANSFQDEGNECHILSFTSIESFYKLNSGVEIIGTGKQINRNNKVTTICSMAYQLPLAYSLLKKKIKQINPDIVVAFLNASSILTSLIPKKLKNYKLVLSERNDPKEINKYYARLLNWRYKKADLFVCQSKKVADYYNNIIKLRSKIVVIPNPCNPDISKVILPKEKENKIVAVGRICKQKNFNLLVRSFKDVSNKFPSTILEIWGEGPLRNELEQLILNLNLQDKVFLRGASKQIFEKIKSTKLFVMSSNYEGFPNALLEAICLGLPVVSTDFGTGVASELIGEKNGRVVPTYDKKALSNVMCEILGNEQLQTEMSKNNLEKRKEYSIEKIFGLWKNELENFFIEYHKNTVR